MYAQIKKAIGIVAILGLVAGPALAEPAQPLGVVLQAEHAQVGVSQAVDGATIFAGDRIATTQQGTLRLRAGASQVYLNANSAAQLQQVETTIQAAILQGSLGFASTASNPVRVVAGDTVIRPQSTQPTHGMVTVVSPTELLVTSYKGALEVSLGAESHIIPEGTSYNVSVAPDPQQPTGAGRRRGAPPILWLALIGAAVGVGIYLALRGGTESPSQP